MPHCTNKLPLSSGLEDTIPFKPIETTLTESPGFSWLGFNTLWVGFLLSDSVSFLCCSVILSLTFVRAFSKS